MDYEIVARELVAAVRGEKSPMLLSRRLGYRGNQLRRWESGERRIAWDDFVRLCEACDAPIRDAVKRIIGLLGEDLNDGSALCRRLIGAASQTKVSEATGISRFTILRWFSGKSSPALADVLAVVQSCQYMVLELIAALVDIEMVPTAHREYVARQERKKVYYRHPIGPAVICCLRLDDYQALPAHSTGFVASKLGITVEEEKLVLEDLERVGKIVKTGQRYEVTAEQLELSDAEGFRGFMSYWLGYARKVLDAATNALPVLGCGLEVYPASAKTARLIRQEYVAFFQRVRALLVQDEGPREMVCMFNSQLVNLTAVAALPKTTESFKASRRPRSKTRRPELTTQ